VRRMGDIGKQNAKPELGILIMFTVKQLQVFADSGFAHSSFYKTVFVALFVGKSGTVELGRFDTRAAAANYVADLEIANENWSA